jgi:poly-gamma-glutamate synthesis protein (capsule biosynthesis protein)
LNTHAEAITLIAAGDIIPTEPFFGRDGPMSTGFARIAELIASADVAVANLDIPLSEQGVPKEKLLTIRASPQLATDIARQGWDVISLANNHSTDYGEVALLDTVEALTGAGIRVVGAGRDLAAATKPAVLEVKGWHVGFVGWTCLLPTGAAASAERPGLAPLHVHTAYEVNPYLLMEEPATPPTVRSWVNEAELAMATAQVVSLREHVDFLAVLVHWGGGLSDEIAEYQPTLGRAFVDAGADVVIGSHQHRVLGIECYRGKAILYSPGTLIEQLDRTTVPPDILPFFDLMSPDSFLARLEIEPDRSYRLRLTPATRGADGIPFPAGGADYDRIAQRLATFSAQHGTDVVFGEGELVVDPATAGVAR